MNAFLKLFWGNVRFLSKFMHENGRCHKTSTIFKRKHILIMKKYRELYFVNITAAHGAFPRSLEKNETVFRQGFLNVYDVLIGGASEKKGRIL